MVFVSASSDESCNLPMVEANACDIPAVVYDTRGDYSDHCEYIKYGLVVNLSKPRKTSREEKVRFKMAMMWMSHYHFCTRGLKIRCFEPVIPKTKFFDFPLSYAEFISTSRKEDLKFSNGVQYADMSTKEWHYWAKKIFWDIEDC